MGGESLGGGEDEVVRWNYEYINPRLYGEGKLRTG
jgi:hypothetical protein